MSKTKKVNIPNPIPVPKKSPNFINPYECKCHFAPCFTTTVSHSSEGTQTTHIFYSDYSPDKKMKFRILPGAADSEEIHQEIKHFWKKVNKLEKFKSFKKKKIQRILNTPMESSSTPYLSISKEAVVSGLLSGLKARILDLMIGLPLPHSSPFIQNLKNTLTEFTDQIERELEL